MFGISFWNIIFALALSFCMTNRIYALLYGKIGYSNFADFFIGLTIQNNYNKYTDLAIYFVYVILAIVLAYLFSLLNKYFKKIDFSSVIKKSYQLVGIKWCFTPFNTSLIKSKLLKFQGIGALGYIFLYPFDGRFYPIVLALVITLLAIAIFDAYFARKCETFSPFCIAPLLFVFLFKSYQVNLVRPDDHHMGETLTAYYLHTKYHLTYYKDIMLVHGISDVLPFWTGHHFFNMFNYKGYTYGNSLLTNLYLIAVCILSLHIFKNNKTVISSFILIFFAFKVKFVSLETVLFVLCYLLLLNLVFESKKYYLPIFLTITFSILFSAYRTTIGSFWIAATAPLFVYAIFKFYKSEDSKKLLKTTLLFVTFGIIAYLLKDFYTNYFLQAPNYVKGNLICFGQNYLNSLPINRIFPLFIAYFSLLATPVCILACVYNLKRRNWQLTLLFLFCIIFPMVSIPYGLGRIGVNAVRIRAISTALISTIIPYLLCIKYDRKILNKVFTCIFCVLLVSATFSTGIKRWGHLQVNIVKNAKTTLHNVEELKFKEEHKTQLENIKKFLEENRCENFFDLTNHGATYFYFEKKAPVLFVSYYNSLTTEQSNNSLSKIKSQLPDIILIYTTDENRNYVTKEGASIALRINSLYRYLLLSKNYELKESNGNIYLVKTKNFKGYSKNDLKLLDKLSNDELNYVPEVWGNSLKTLPLAPVDLISTTKLTTNGLEITFDQKIQGKDIGLILFETEEPELKNQEVEFTVKNSNSNSELKFKTKNGRALFPFDNYPSWLLQDAEKLTITLNKNLSTTPKIEFYKRSNNLE